MTSSFHGSAGHLEVHTEQIDVTSALPRPDERWTYTDRAGHEHHWREGYPTLVRVVDEIYYCGDCAEDHEEAHLECPVCHEQIEPGTVVDTFRRYAPGRTSYTLDGQPITKEQAAAFIEEARRAARG